MTRNFLLTLIAALFTACASAGQQAASNASTSGRETFTSEQLSTAAAANVYDALNVLEPRILNGNGRGEPDVYVGTVKQTQGLDRLRHLSINDLAAVTYLRYDQARGLPDQHSSGGAIVVALP